MSALARSPALVEREPVTVMFARCADEIEEVQRLWPWFEETVGPRGRRMYAAVDVASGA